MIVVIVRLFKEILARGLVRGLRKRVVIVALLAALLWLVSGASFYYVEAIVEHHSIDLWSALYWALVTMSTVGYGDIVPSRGLGWLVAGFTIVAGITVYSLFVSTLADLFMEAGLRKTLGLAPLKGKEILVIGDAPECRDLVDELVANGLGGKTGWLLTQRPETEPPVDYMIGDPRKKSDLEKAGAGRARVIALCLEDDSAALHVALSVRRVNRDARLVAVARSPETEELLREAGVDHVASASLLGRVLASAVFEPLVARFIEEVSTIHGTGDLVEVRVGDELAGVSVVEAERLLGERMGSRVKILAVSTGEGFVLAPPGDMRLEKGYKLVALLARSSPR